jgi:hypothetical protein
MHVYEVKRRKDRRGFDLISEALPFGRLWYEDASAAVDYDEPGNELDEADLYWGRIATQDWQ